MGSTGFALFYIFQQLFWKGCELKGRFSQTWYHYNRVKLKWKKVVLGILVTQKVTCCFYCPFSGVSISVTLYGEHRWNKTLVGSGLRGYFLLHSTSTSFLPPSSVITALLQVPWDITSKNKYVEGQQSQPWCYTIEKVWFKELSPQSLMRSSCPILFSNQPMQSMTQSYITPFWSEGHCLIGTRPDLLVL